MTDEHDHPWVWGEDLSFAECDDTDCGARGVIVPAEGVHLVVDGEVRAMAVSAEMFNAARAALLCAGGYTIGELQAMIQSVPITSEGEDE
jgi:hypothetical protein